MDPRHALFRVSGDPDGQILLALAVLLGPRSGMSAAELWDDLWLGDGSPSHPSIDADWISHWHVARALGRLQGRGLVCGGSKAWGEESLWRPTQLGYAWLHDRLLMEPADHAREGRHKRPSAA